MNVESDAKIATRRQFVSRAAGGLAAGALVPLALTSKHAQAATISYVTPQDFGALGNGVNDDTSAVQNAVNAIVTSSSAQALYIPPGKYKLTSTVTIARGITIFGDGCEPYRNLSGSVMGVGSWFYLAHTGIGFLVKPTTVGLDASGCLIEAIGTYRDQPTPTTGAYVPNAHDWDIYVTNADVRLSNLTLLNPTKAICVANDLAQPNYDPFSRVTIQNIRGQPLSYGIYIKNTMDVCRISDIHWWVFWKEDNTVWAYMQDNFTALQLDRCDTAFISRLFAIFVHTGIRISGQATNISMDNISFDSTFAGLVFDASVNGVNAQISNLVLQGAPSSGAANNAIEVNGTTCLLDISNIKAANYDGSILAMNGASGQVGIVNLWCFAYDNDHAGHPAISAAAGNVVTLSGRVSIQTIPGTTWFGGSGTILSNLAQGTKSGTTDASGYLTVAQGFGVTPKQLFIQSSNTASASNIAVDMLSTSGFRTRHFGPTGAPLASAAVAFHWKAEYS